MPSASSSPRSRNWPNAVNSIAVAVIAALVFTPERAKVMDFSLPYLTLRSAVFARQAWECTVQPAQ